MKSGEISLQNLVQKERSIYDVYSNACGGAGSSSTAMAEAEPCCPAAGVAVFGAVDESESVRANASGSLGRRSLNKTKPEGADFTGTYLLSSRNLMNFSWAGTTLAGLVKISNDGSGSAFFSVALST